MLHMLVDGIRGAGRLFSDERRRDSDGGKPSPRGASRGYRAALSVACKLLVVAVALNAFAVRAQTTTIVASGVWNGVAFTPSCNYTTRYTWNITHANGVYSATQNTSNVRGSNCQDTGPGTCGTTGFFASAQDLLTTSQFQALRNAFNASCRNPPNVVKSVTFTSPDSVSGTAIQFDGRDAGWQLTRATSIPTSYALAVAKSGTGSGFVSSSPTGIDCGATCFASFASGTKVILSATPVSGSTFAGWRGACTGTGTCTVTMGAAKKVGAAFRIRPFTAATSKVITGNRATISNTITFNPSDVGKPGAVFVTAWVPANALGTLGISVAADSLLSITSTAVDPSLAGAANKLHLTRGPLAERDTSEFVLVQLTASGWQLVVNGQLIPYASGVLGDQLASQTILNGTDTTNLIGAQFCVGYGTDATDMIAAGNVQLIETIPDQTATSDSSGSCIVNDMIVYLEEPTHGGTASGVGNVRGWAVSLQPIQRMDLYIDGSLAFTVPYGGSRSDVGAAYASYPESTNSGFSMAYNFGLLSAGSHTFLTRALDDAGNVTDATATFNVVRFPNSFIADAADVSLVGASATIVDANTLRLDNVMVQGVSYNLTLRWNTATQGFALVATN